MVVPQQRQQLLPVLQLH
jgi:hypothetical protein